MSEIENIVTTNDELFKAAHAFPSTQTPATKEALRYSSALHQGFELIQTKPLSIPIATSICSTIQGFDVSLRDYSGTYIGKPGTAPRIYTPPEGREVIQKHLDSWETYLHNTDDDIDILVKMALLHYQFEAIHPYSDGNGRTGRILNVLYLVEKEVLKFPITYLSGYIV